MGQALNMIKVKERLNVVYEPDQIDAANDEVKFQLLKLQVMFHDTLTKTEKDIINSCCVEFADFDGMVVQIRDSLVGNRASELIKEPFWMGTRMEVEMPSSTAGAMDKNIEPEILS